MCHACICSCLFRFFACHSKFYVETMMYFLLLPVMFVSYLVSCCRLLKWCSWSTLWCVADCSVVCCTVQWCTWPALRCVADCSVVFCRLFCGVHGQLCGVLQRLFSGVHGPFCGVLQRLFSGVHGLLCGVLQSVQWCFADCSVVYMVLFVVCCRDCSVFCRLFSGVHGLLCGVLQTVQWC